MDIGKKILYLRKAKGITQSQLAEYLSVTPQTVSRWEANNGVPDIYLLPNIATFFSVSLEELFGISNMEKTEKLVYKYSILRDEKSYEEAMTAIESGLDNTGTEEEKQQLLAEKMHMFLQRSRAYLNKADDIADILIDETVDVDNPLHLPVRFQKTQFNIHNGKAQETILQAKSNYEQEPSAETLQLYMCSLHEAFRDREVLALYQDDFVRNILSSTDETAIQVWGMLFSAAVNENDLDFYQAHFPSFEKFADKESVFTARIGLTRIYAKRGMVDEKNKCKEKMLGEVSFMQNNELLMQMYIEKIREI